MIYFNKIVFISLSIFILAIVFFMPFATIAITQVANPIVFNNAIKGESYYETLILINNSDKNDVFLLTAEGDISSWTSFEDMDTGEKINDVAIPANDGKNIRVIFTVPSDAENRKYEGKIFAAIKPEEKDGESGKITTSVTFRIPRSVSINVSGEQSIKAECDLIIGSKNIKIGENLQYNIWCKNTGNVRISPEVFLTITNPKTKVIIASIKFPFVDSENSYIAPNQTKKWKTELSISPNYEVGNYMVASKILLNNESILERFHVVEINANNTTNKVLGFSQASLSQIMNNKQMILVIAIICGLVLLFTIINIKKLLWSKKKLEE